MRSDDSHPVMMQPEQCRAARAWLGWTQEELARRSAVGLSTIKDFEMAKRQPLAAIRMQLQRTFEAAGVEFLEDSMRVKPSP
jgi:ribosome-binding protein aMBF1 (putative translation factor)